MKKVEKIRIDTISLDVESLPKVLLVGNGLLQLADGISWEALLNDLKNRNVSKGAIEAVPYCMRPELLCEMTAEEIRRQVGRCIAEAPLCCSAQLKQLLTLDFDCILTTNYSYEIEHILTAGKWNSSMRKRCVRVMDGSPYVHHNLSVCYEIPRLGKKPVQVWHIHGDALRHTSMILSYYSYANAIYRLQEYNKRLGNDVFEHQQENRELVVHSWLDWFLIGDVFTVGYGFGFSEIDLWWALERKKRENAQVGKLFYMNVGKDKPAECQALLEALGAECHNVFLRGREWADGYDEIVEELASMISK